MDDFELLQQLFGDKLIQAEEGNYGKPQLILQEKGYSICIKNVPENVVAIKTDSFPDLGHFFHCSGDGNNLLDWQLFLNNHFQSQR
jgi:hypothetical protein